ncbi:MAG: hypothetical protein N2578_08655 [Bdellovibrionaceae bacterium]|nr:hypothetical protein [Pseudobdellovibrionaceae bacterium]
MQKRQNSPLTNILVNVLIPVMILNHGQKIVSPQLALVFALALPLGYGVKDWWTHRQTNWFSVLGIINVAVTGVLAVLNLSGVWFAVKEAAFPALIAIFVLASTWTSRPFMKTLFYNPAVLRLDLIEARLRGLQDTGLNALFRQATIGLAASFTLSAVLNWLLARRIFLDPPQGLSPEALSQLLNEQIARMTSWSFLIIFVPNILVMAALLWFFLSRLKTLTGLSLEELLPTSQNSGGGSMNSGGGGGGG